MGKHRSLVIAIIGILVMAFMVGIMTQATEKNSAGDAALPCKQIGMIADAYCHPWAPGGMDPNVRELYAGRCTKYTVMYFNECGSNIFRV